MNSPRPGRSKAESVAIGCQVEIADKIVAQKADYPLALKGGSLAPTVQNSNQDIAQP
jgi:hypothetical protein